MREEFKQIAKELEEKDVWFRDVLSKKTTIDTSLETWSVTRDVAEKLYSLVLEHKPQHIVEVGMSQGYSTIWLAEAAQTYGGKVTTIEIEESKIEAARHYFDQLGFHETISIFPGNACDVLKEWKQPVDFLFLDAVKREYVTCLSLLDPFIPVGGIVIADDVIEWRRKLDEFFAYIQEGNRYTGETISLGHGLFIGQKKAS